MKLYSKIDDFASKIDRRRGIENRQYKSFDLSCSPTTKSPAYHKIQIALKQKCRKSRQKSLISGSFNFTQCRQQSFISTTLDTTPSPVYAPKPVHLPSIRPTICLPTKPKFKLDRLKSLYAKRTEIFNSRKQSMFKARLISLVSPVPEKHTAKLGKDLDRVLNTNKKFVKKNTFSN